MIPRLNAPPGACDAHVHIFEAATIATTGKALEVAPLADYLHQREELGIARTVFVQPSAFGFDSRGVLAATQAVGPQARAVVTIPSTITEDEVAALTLNIFHRHTDRVKLAAIAQMVNVLQAMILTDKDKMLLTPTYHVYDMYLPFQGATPYPAIVSGPHYVMGSNDMSAVDVSAARIPPFGGPVECAHDE